MAFRYLIVLSLFLFMFCPARAAQPDSIGLHIVDGWDNRPVGGVTVGIDGVIFTSDAQGLIRIKIIDTRQPLHLEKTGYYPLNLDSGTVHPNQIIRLFPIMDSDTIEVAGSRLGFSELEIASQTQRIESRSFGYTSSLGDLLAPQNGVFLKAYGGSESTQSISMRGLGAEQTLILLDGIPINSGQTGVVDLQRYRPSFFDELEIYRGGFSTMAGSGAIGGMINMSSKIQPDGIAVGYERRSHDQEQIEAALNTHIGIARHNIRFGSDRGPNHYIFKLDDQVGTRENSDYRYDNFSSSWKSKIYSQPAN